MTNIRLLMFNHHLFVYKHCIINQSCFSWRIVFQPLRKVMAHPYKQNHDCYIILQKEYQRFLKIKEGKMIYQEHIPPNFPLYERIRSISGDKNGNPTKQPSPDSNYLSDSRKFFYKPLCNPYHHAPVQPQMKRHQYKSPIGGNHMNLSDESPPAFDWQK